MFDDAEKEVLDGKRLRERGPEPTVTDAEVLTMETVGEFEGICQDKKLFLYFRRHYSHFFPGLKKISRTTFTRQASNLWKVKSMLWQYLLNHIEYDPTLAIVDSMPIYACQFARAYRCIRFGGKAAYGKDILIRQTFYGFRIHVYLAWPGVITGFSLAPANEHESKVVPELVKKTLEILLGDRNYWIPRLKEELAQDGINLQAPFRKASSDPWPEHSALISRIRYRIDTVFGQLTDRFNIKKVWAKDMWHLYNRLLRKILSHTLAFMLNQKLGNPPLQFDKILTA
jgi:Transposase DDE domain.